MDSMDEQLRAWLKGISEDVAADAPESDVDDCVWPTYRKGPLADKAPGAPRLLEILGYGPGDVAHKKNIPLARGKGLEPDFRVTVQGQDVLVVENKAPAVRIDDGPRQASDYFLKVHAPLALIFNTREAMLIVNARLPELSEFKELESEFVMRASIDRRPQIVQLLKHLTAPSSRAEMVDLAKALARKRVAQIEKERRGRERREIINNAISSIKRDPPTYLLQTLIANDESLRQIPGVRVKPEEVRDAWLGRTPQWGGDGEIEVRGEFRGESFTASFNPRTRMVVYADNPPCKPAPAGLCAIRTVEPRYKAVNGWDWWKYRDDGTGEWVPITRLRETANTKG